MRLPAARLRPRLMRAALAAALAVAFGACSREDAPAPEPDTPEVISVSTQLARLGTISDRITATGTVVPARGADLVVFAPESALILELPKAEGDAVKAGDLLVRFDIATLTMDLTLKESAVTQAKDRVDAAAAEVKKLSALADQGLIARADLEAARASHTAAESELAAANADLELTRTRLAQTVVRATFPGIVLRRWHVEGDLVLGTPEDPILRVVDPARLQVTVPLPVADLARIVVGRPAAVRGAGLPDEPATVASRPATPAPDVLVADVRLNFAGPTTLTLDTMVDVDIIIDELPDALIVPRGALQRDEEATYVYVVGEDQIARRRPVTTGFTTREHAQILSGLSAGDRVITTSLDLVHDGAAVVIAR